MKLDAHLVQRPEQRLALLPQMLQSIEVLQMATVDLLARIDVELENNETLEVEPRRESPAADGTVRRNDDGDRKQAMLNNVPAESDSLLDFIREQLAFGDLDVEVRRAVQTLAEHLDERGLLPFTSPELEAMTGLQEELLRTAIGALQELEPRGLGARSSVEAMLLQVAGDPDEQDIRTLLTEHLEALAQSRVAEVARQMDLTVEAVRRLLERVRSLDPRPGSTFAPRAEPAIRPDARTWVEDGELKVSVDDGVVPILSVNSQYRSLLQSRATEASVRDYLRGKVRSAQDLIDAIRNRQETLARVVAAVLTGQPGFLAIGRRGIRPMRMADVAENLGVHTSTVSRAIAGKYVQTGQGVFRLRDFFDGGGGSGGMEATGTGRMAVHQLIADLVDGEDKAHPLSDDQLVDELSQRGITVARRTVSKYRKELGIPSSFLRRREIR